MDLSLHFYYLFFLIFFLTFKIISSRGGVTTSPPFTVRKWHDQWMAQHERTYESVAEKEYRFHIFKKNMKHINKFNNDGVNKSYKLAPNAFSDLTEKEFLETYTGFTGQSSTLVNSSSFVTKNSNEEYTNNILPTVDWRKQGAVTPVKAQKGCGACWAFTAVAALEGIFKIKTQKLIDFSEQNLIDCDLKNRGCSGGTLTSAFDYIKLHGIKTEEHYPYMAKKGNCNPTLGDFIIRDYEKLRPHDVSSLISAVERQPVSIAIEATSFRHYSGGVYDGGCSDKVNHALTVIGYGTDDKTKKNYWLVKNSWGDTWGEQGYMKLLMDENVCPVTLFSSYPTLD